MSALTIIAIDGPAASGKSSVARRLAARLAFAYVNTGAMYRAATWIALREKVDISDETRVRELLAKADMRCILADGELKIAVSGCDPTPHLDDAEVAASVSKVASILEVRARLVEKQRELAAGANVVMEGRDIGTVVFPQTPYKFYIDASPEVRVQRRVQQGLTDDLANRDRQDSQRKSSPLAVAPDAEVIDSTHLSIEQVVDEIVRKLTQKGFKQQ